MILGFILTLLILSVLVLIHEAGHYFVAKWFGIKVEEFGFGLPPRAWGKKIGETIYSVNWLPIGGFVKLFGEDEAGAGRVDLSKKDHEEHAKLSKHEQNRAFFSRPAWQRALVVVAGVVMNALLAFIIYYIYMGVSQYQTTLPLLSDHKFFLVNQVNVDSDKEPIVTYVSGDSPAEKAGMKAPARITSLNEVAVRDVEDVITIVSENKGKTVPISWQEVKVVNGKLSYGQTHTSVFTPRANPPENEGPTGIAFLPVALLHYETPTQQLLSGISHPLNLMAYNYDIITKLIARSFEKKDPTPVSQAVSGPVGVFSIGGTIGQIPDIKERFLQFLNLAGILSISLAIFNVLPIPALDGGRLFFILIEMIFRKKVRANVENYAHSIGMALLIALILLVTFKDILQLF